jgi:lactoylglutathione lyase
VGAAHLCLLVDDIHAEVRRLRAAGARFVSEPQYFGEGPDAGSWAVYLLDPDGITVELAQSAASAQDQTGSVRGAVPP